MESGDANWHTYAVHIQYAAQDSAISVLVYNKKLDRSITLVKDRAYTVLGAPARVLCLQNTALLHVAMFSHWTILSSRLGEV